MTNDAKRCLETNFKILLLLTPRNIQEKASVSRNKNQEFKNFIQHQNWALLKNIVEHVLISQNSYFDEDTYGIDLMRIFNKLVN